MSIRRKIILICIAIFLVVIGINSTLNAVFFNKSYTEAKLSELTVTTQVLASQLDRLLEMHIPIEQLSGFDRLCADLVRENPLVSYAKVIAPDGAVLFHSIADQQGHQVTEKAVLKALEEQQRLAQIIHLKDRNHYECYIPVIGDDQKVVATVCAGFPVAFVIEKTKALLWGSLGITLPFFGAGLTVLILLLTTWVTKPFDLFMKRIDRIKEEWSYENHLIEVGSKDEIGTLANNFNSLIGQLRDTTVSKNYVDYIVENMLNSLIVLDSNHVISRVNQETLDFLGYQKEEMIGEKMETFFPGKADLFQPEDMNSDGKKEIKSIETNYLAKDETLIPVLFSSCTMKDEEGITTGYICVAQNITEVKTLRGFLPICATCKKIRNDKGYWDQLEKYICEHSDAVFSHGICPECAEEVRQELKLRKPIQKDTANV